MADNKRRGTPLDSFLQDEGVHAEFKAKAIKDVIALQLAGAMRERQLSKKRLAALSIASANEFRAPLGARPGELVSR